MPPSGRNANLSRAQSMRFNFGPGGILGSFSKKKRQSMSPVTLLGGAIAASDLSRHRNNPLLMKAQDMDFVKDYEQHKLTFDVTFDAHRGTLRDLQGQLEKINLTVEALSAKNEELIERIFHNTLDFETCHKGKTAFKTTNQMKLKELFKMFDKDENGVITEEELKIGLKKLGKTHTDEEIATMMQAADSNGNCSIDFGEFISLMISVL